MKFKKSQYKLPGRGGELLGYFHSPFNADGSFAFHVPIIVEEISGDSSIFLVNDHESFNTLAEAKKFVRRFFV